MNYANFRRDLSDSWLTFTTNRRDQVALILARWSFYVYGDDDGKEWVCSIAMEATARADIRKGRLKS